MGCSCKRGQLIIENINALKEQIIEKIKPLDVLAVNEFYNGYTPSFKLKPLVCVYLKRLAIDSCSLNNLISATVSHGELNSLYGKKCRISLGLNIYCNTPKCDNIFTEIATLLMSDEDVHIEELNCISIEYQPMQKAYMLQGELVVSKIIAAASLDTCVTGFNLTVNNKQIKEVT